MKVLRRLVAVLGLSAAATSVGAPTQEGYLHARIAELDRKVADLQALLASRDSSDRDANAGLNVSSRPLLPYA